MSVNNLLFRSYYLSSDTADAWTVHLGMGMSAQNPRDSRMRYFVYIIPVILMLLATGCDDPETTETTETKHSRPTEPTAAHGVGADDDAPPVIGLVMKTLTNPFFIDMEKGARRAERDLGIRLLVRTGAQETSVEQQIVIVEDLIAAPVDALVIAPGDSVRLIPPLKAAQDAGIAVVNIDNRLDPRYADKLGLSGVPFISVDNEQAAYLSARTLVADVTAPTQAVILEGIPTAANARDRKHGALRAFAENPNIQVVAARSADWKIGEGYRVTAALLEAFPEVGLIFAANDMMGLGALQRLGEIGRTDVRVAAYDALDEAVAAVRAGRLVATVDQKADQQGYLGIEYAVRLMRGEAVPSVTLLDVDVITGDTLP